MINKKYYLLVFILICIPLFCKLGNLPIHVWDEARLGVNAIEMKLNGQYLVTYFGGSPDMWNTKPPLLIWVQVICFNIFGINEFALRLPSAIAALATCLLIWGFCSLKLNKPWLGMFAALVLVTTNGYIHSHVARTGDYETLLILFTTLQCISFYLFIEEGKNKWLYLFFGALVLAILTKSVAGLFFLPAFFIYTIVQKKLFVVLKNVHLYFGLILLLGFVLGYYFLREKANPGYLQAVWNNELGGRMLIAQEDNFQPWWFYLNQIVSGQLSIWFYLIPFGVFLGLKKSSVKVKSLTLLLSISISSFLLIISLSQTKLKWYDAPIFPLTAILIAFVLDFFWENKQLSFPKKSQKRMFNLFSIVLIVISITAYTLVLIKVISPRLNNYEKKSFERLSYLRNAHKNNIDLNNQTFLFSKYYADYYFYILALKQENIHIEVQHFENAQPNSIVFLYEDDAKNYLEDHYICMLLRQDNQMLTYKINEKLPESNNPQ